jgi:peptide chain release factor 2
MSIQNLKERIEELQTKAQNTSDLLKLQEKKNELVGYDIEMSEESFWDNQEKAREVSQKASELREEIERWDNILNNLKDLLDLAESDDKELEDQIEKELEQRNNEFNKLEFYVLFSGKYDKNNAILSIHAGAGGVDAQDWTEMITRMYLRFFEKKNWLVEIIDESKGQEAGIKSITMHIKGRNAYGHLKSENGVHRLVRISPFDAEAMRHTSFALVDILPELNEDSEIEIKEEDIRIDVFKASGHGGQGVNTTDSAVRIVHLPTDITVVCRNERSQLQNKETAMKILRAKLLERQEEEKAKKESDLRGEVQKAEWGSQIRSYVLHPYKMVKDHRTKYETQDTEAVLDGEIDQFIEEYLKNLKK